MKPIRTLLAVSLLTALFTGALTAQLYAATNSPSEKWEKDIQTFEAADRKNPPPRGAILFIGSSSIRLWKTLAEDFPEHDVINRGFGGSQIEDSVHFANRIVTPYQPRLIVLFAGGNDINAGKTPEQVFGDFRAFVEKVRGTLPAVRIAYMSSTPAPIRWAQADRQRRLNQLIKDYVAAGQNLDYIDMFDAFLGPDGRPREELYVTDRLHNNAAGYKIRAALTRPHLGPPTKSSAEKKPDRSALYLDPSQPLEKRVQDLLGRLTLEEKATLLNHRGPDLERFGIKSDKWNQCLHGVWWTEPTTMFPLSIAMAATWDPRLIREVAKAISDEARAIYNGWHQDPNFKGEKKGLIYRAPVINISRNPYWGRINECYGEDPFLTGRIGVSFVQGLQGNDPRYLKLVSTLKHYAVNNVEKDRQRLSAAVSERMLHEYWLPHFRDCIVEGQAQSVMASYNAINGVPNNINRPLLTDILKNQWGFQGFVVSDLGGVKTMVEGHAQGQMSYEEAVAKSLVAGCDFSDKEYMEHIPAAVRQGLLPEARLNDAVFRVMRDRFRLGEFDPPEMVPYSKIPPSVIGCPAHRQLSLTTARKAIVLLSNKDGFLPLDKTKLKSIAVLGPHADLFTAGGYSGKVKNPVNPLQGLKNRAAPGTEILHAKGAEIAPPRRAPAPPFNREEELRRAAETAKRADVAIVFVGTTLDVEAEGRDRTSLELPGHQEELVKTVLAANPRTVVVLLNAGPLTIPWIKEHAPAIVEAWWAGEEGGHAIADVIFGDANPGGRLPFTVYASASQVPPQDEYDVTKGFTYMYVKGAPLFPFGHGLSYTTFRYSNLQVAPSRIPPDGRAAVSVEVENTGPRAGDEVVQVYVHDVECSVTRPSKELRGFERVSLKPGEKRTVTFSLNGGHLAFYDAAQHRFTVEPGAFDVLVGSSSEDIRLRGRLDVP